MCVLPRRVEVSRQKRTVAPPDALLRYDACVRNTMNADIISAETLTPEGGFVVGRETVGVGFSSIFTTRSTRQRWRITHTHRRCVPLYIVPFPPAAYNITHSHTHKHSKAVKYFMMASPLLCAPFLTVNHPTRGCGICWREKRDWCFVLSHGLLPCWM